MSEADLRALSLDLERHCTQIDQATNSLSLHKHNEIADARHDDLIAPMSWDWLFDTVTPPSPHHPFTASLKSKGFIPTHTGLVPDAGTMVWFLLQPTNP
jgi:hypothetical protein